MVTQQCDLKKPFYRGSVFNPLNYFTANVELVQVSILGDECCCLLFVHVVVLLRSLSQARLRTNNPLWKYGRQRALEEL